jgi:hypothetical protein
MDLPDKNILEWLGVDSERVPYYLHPLNLVWSKEGAEHDLKHFRQVAEKLEADLDYWAEIIRDAHWRPSLAGCTCLLVSPRHEFFEELCFRFRAGSFIAPQIAVTLGLLHGSAAGPFFESALDDPILRSRSNRRLQHIESWCVLACTRSMISLSRLGTLWVGTKRCFPIKWSQSIGSFGRNEFDGSRVSVASRRFQNHVGVGDGVAGADEADGVGDAFFEFNVWLERQFGAFQCVDETSARGFGVRADEFLGHPGFADHEIGAQGAEHIEHAGDIVAQRNVHGLDLRPEGEAAVGDDDGVGVAHAREQRENVGIEDSSFKHNASMNRRAINSELRGG